MNFYPELKVGKLEPNRKYIDPITLEYFKILHPKILLKFETIFSFFGLGAILF